MSVRTRILWMGVCVLLGCITTVAVAWTCVIRSEVRLAWGGTVAKNSKLDVDGGTAGQGYISVNHEWSMGYEQWTVRRLSFLSGMWPTPMVKPEQQLPHWALDAIDAPREEPAAWLGFDTINQATRAGWPWPALIGSRREAMSGGGVNTNQPPSFRRGLMMAPAWMTRWSGGWGRAMPIGVVPIGFIGNMLVYGAVWWGVLWCVGWSVRRFIRWRRGEKNSCRACGYSREGLETNRPCPECGEKEAGVLGRSIAE